MTPLHMAAKKGHYILVDKRCFKIDIKDGKGVSVWNYTTDSTTDLCLS